ncbi:hypothetical protein [Sutterella wadsworthensis]|uniref:hypothetical protein n=1 Tax=Sutterella wadsworthensis TaxID=40545 RepID=UPI003966C4BB
MARINGYLMAIRDVKSSITGDLLVINLRGGGDADGRILHSLNFQFICLNASFLAGTLIGGGVTLLAAHMTIKHQNELEDTKRRSTLEDDWRLYERENLTRLQETIQHSMRANAKCYAQMLKQAAAGRSSSEWIVDDDDSEAQRQFLEDILLLGARLPGSELNEAMTLYREKTRRVTLESRNESQLNAAMSELLEQYDTCMALVGERLRACVGGDEH